MGKYIILTALLIVSAFAASCVKRDVPYLPGMGSAPTPVAEEPLQQ